MPVGLIGFGRLGRLLVRHFSRDFDIYVHDSKPDPRAVRALGASPATLAEACAQKTVIIAVPISNFEAAVRAAAPHLRPGALVMDVCTVKEHPVRVMKRLLPKSVQILATHPNFGPDSAADSLRGRKLVACPIRVSAKNLRKFARAAEKKGLEIVRMSPAEHDKKIAASLVLTHFIGRGLSGYGSKTTGIDTEGYKRLLAILQTVENDSWQLFEDMNRYNAYAPAMRRKFLGVLRALDARLKK